MTIEYKLAAPVEEVLHRGLTNLSIVVPCDYIPRIQEVQASIYHTIRECIEALRHD